MNIWLAATILTVVLLVLLAAGMRVAFVVFIVGFVGLFFLLSPPQPMVAGAQIWKNSYSYVLTAIPLFIVMAEFFMRTGLVSDIYDTITAWFGGIRGSEAQSTVVACAGFASIAGSSVANAAAVGGVAIPEMLRRGYSRKLTFGVVAAGGTLGILIPPSGTMIVYAAMTGESTGHLFMGGVVPGAALALMYMAVVAVWGWWRPSHFPLSGDHKTSWKQKLASLANIGPAVVLVGVTMGGIYGGVFTATEAAAIGTFVALLICLAKRRMTWTILRDSLTSAVKTSSMIMLIVMGTSLVTYVLGFTQLAGNLAKVVLTSGLATWQVLLVISLFYVLLGCFIESVSLVVLTVPIVYPLVKALGLDPVWFGILLVIYVEMGLITPPVGLNLFVIQSIAGEETFGEAAAGSLPFFIAMCVLVVALVAYPPLATWLPSTMLRR